MPNEESPSTSGPQDSTPGSDNALSTEELAEIRQRWNWPAIDLLPSGRQSLQDVRALLAEVERLRTREDEVMEFVEYVASQPPEWLATDGRARRIIWEQSHALLGYGETPQTENEQEIQLKRSNRYAR